VSDQFPDATKMMCPFCGAEPKPNWAESNTPWFTCGTMVNRRRFNRKDQSETCEVLERARLISELTTLRTANAALVERVKRLEEVLNRILDNNGSRNEFRAIGLYDAQVDAERLLAGVES